MPQHAQKCLGPLRGLSLWGTDVRNNSAHIFQARKENDVFVVEDTVAKDTRLGL